MKVTESMPQPAPPASRHRLWNKEWLIQVLALLLAVGISVTIFLFRDRIEQAAATGSVGWYYTYAGVFLISIAVSATVILPAPGWVIIATLGATLNPFLVGIVSAMGGTVGELTGYLLGYGGRPTIRNISLDWRSLRWLETTAPHPVSSAAKFLRSIDYPRMVGWMNRRGGWVIFVLALVPNPLFDVAGAVAGAVRMPVWKFMLYGFLGRTPKHIAYALAGGFGLGILGCIGPG